MAATLRHRGPDDHGVYSDQTAWLAHRRLSIVDLALGHQPMSNEDERLWVVYNGEIFNHLTVRRELEQAGHRYATRSDTETILHAYEQHGSGCVDFFRGMFSFALWDKRARTLFCARDRLGKKPFYYYFDGRLFAFASEIKALFEHPAISARLQEELLGEHLCFGYTSGDRTLFQGIRKLMPGHRLMLTVEADRLRLKIERYWDVPAVEPETGRSAGAWTAECRERLEESVRMRLMSDVPLGMLLSGGLDSSLIAALMARMVPGRVQSFSVGYPESAYSELSYAVQAARHIGTDHHEVVVSREEFFDALPGLIWHEDEPLCWPSSVSLYFVCKLASQHVKVVLTGEGGDELFAGYGRYRLHLFNHRCLSLYRWVPSGWRRRLREAIASSRLLNGDVRRKLQHTVLGRREGLPSLYLDNFYAAFDEAALAALLRAGTGEATPYGSFLGYWDARAASPLLQRLLYADQKTYLVELLMKQDQMSMATSIESRVPFLDHCFVEFAARVPDSLKLNGGQGKFLLKKVAEDLLPGELIYRSKMGFPTPLRAWFRQPETLPLLRQLLDPGGLLGSYLDLSGVDALLQQHAGGQQDATDRLWRLLNLQIWGEVFLRGRSPEQWRESLSRAGGIASAS